MDINGHDPKYICVGPPREIIFDGRKVPIPGESRLRPEIMDWLNDHKIEYIFKVIPYDPEYWFSLKFKNKTDEILFKLTWI